MWVPEFSERVCNRGWWACDTLVKGPAVGAQGQASEEALGIHGSFYWAEAPGQSPHQAAPNSLSPQLSAQMHACLGV